MRIVEEAHPVDRRDVLESKRVADLERADVGVDVLRDLHGQCLDVKLARHVGEDAAGVLDSDWLTDEVDDDRRLDRLVEPNLTEVDVRDGAADRVALHVGEHRRMHRLLALDDDVENRVQPRRSGHRCPKVPLGDQDRARVAFSVEDARDESARAQAAHVARPALLSLLHFELETFS